jgi:hypothetical protein
MIHIDQMLSDYAAVYAGKLVVSGAGINILVARPAPEGYVVSFGVGLLIKVPPQATNRNHRVVISVADADGRKVTLMENQTDDDVRPEDKGSIIGDFNIQRAANMTDEDEAILPLAFQFNGQYIPHEGSYTIRAEVDGIELSYTRFQVLAQQADSPLKLALAD